jgi:hypothetical protein
VHPQPPDGRRPIAAQPCEAGADDEVCVTGEKRREDHAQLPGVVLTVAVDLNGDVEAVGERVAVAGLHGAADAEVEREPQHSRAGCLGERAGAIGRAVVHDEHLESEIDALDLLDDAPDCRRLVQSRHDRDALLHERPF